MTTLWGLNLKGIRAEGSTACAASSVFIQWEKRVSINLLDQFEEDVNNLLKCELRLGDMWNLMI